MINSNELKTINILFLHHSTGQLVIKGGINKYIYKYTRKGNVHRWFKGYNRRNNKNYNIDTQPYPKRSPYGWNNYPYDYYNIWVRNCGLSSYLSEPTLEILTKKYDLIIFKHCYPVCRVDKKEESSLNSEEKTIENYKLQYTALKKKIYQFPNTKFLVWTGAALVKNAISEEQAKNTKEFFKWVVSDWDEKNDNIFVWDFYNLETGGELYLKSEYARGINDSHISNRFAKKVYPLFCQRIVDVIEGRGDVNSITGHH